MDPYINIGHTKKAHGLKGELKVFIEERYWEDFLKNERIFIDIKGAKVPYFIVNVRGGGDAIMELEEVDNRNAAEGLQSREIFLRPQDLIPEEERELELEEDRLEYGYLAGFLMTDKILGEIGVIGEVLEMPQQEMAFLRYKDREVLVPLNEQFILSVDEQGKTVVVELPEGMLDV